MLIISHFFKYILDKDNQRFTFFLLFILMIGGFGWMYSKYAAQKIETQKQLNNIEALLDTVRVYEDETGKVGAEKLSLQTSLNQLKTLNQTLYNELQKEKGNVKVVTKTEYVVKTDTLVLDSSVDFTEDTYKLSFKNETTNPGGYRILSGYTSFKWDQENNMPFSGTTTITDDVLSMKLVTGVREEDGKLTIFIKTDYPGVKFSNIEGAVLDNSMLNTDSKASRFTLGIQAGYGLTSSGFSPYIGAGVTYKLLN